MPHSIHPRQQKPTRVLQIVGAMNRGGTEVMIMNLLRNRKPEDPDFDFVYFTHNPCDFDEELINSGCRIFRIAPKWKLPRLLIPVYRFRHLYRILRRYPYDIIHTHTLNSNALWLIAARLCGIPKRIAHAHNTQDAGGRSFFRKWYHKYASALIVAHATHLVACGQEAGRYLFGSIFNRDGIVLPNGIDMDAYELDKKSCRLRLKELFGINGDSLIIAQIGRFQQAKNHVFTLQIMRTLQDKGVNFHVLMVGAGPLDQEIKSLSKKMGISGGVTFTGVRSDIPQLLNGIDVLLMPSHHEGLPVVPIEAQAAGIPCILSDNIAAETDLGLGLVRFLSLKDTPSEWGKHLQHAGRIPPPSTEKKKKTFREKNYDIRSSAAIVRHIYKAHEPENAAL